MKILCTTLGIFVLLVSSSFAADQKWEYTAVELLRAVSAMKMDDVKEWTKVHRPKLYETIEAKGKGEKEAAKALTPLEAVEASGDVSNAAYDYYLNLMAKDGWELFIATEKMLYFRREAMATK